MRVAFLIGDFPLLSETFVLDQITGLVDRGCAVDVFGHVRQRASLVHPDIASYGIAERVRSYGIPEAYGSRVVAGVGILTSRGAPNHRALVRSLNAFRYGLESLSLNLLFEAAAFGGDGAYDVVHCHFGPNGLTGARLREVGALRGRLVTTFYGYDVSRQVRRHGRRYYDQLAKAGDLFLVLGATMREDLLRLGFPEERVVVHRLGVDLVRFSRPARGPRPGAPTRLVSVARLVPKKGIEYGIRAVAELVAEGHAVEYAVVGDGPLRGDLERLAVELGVGDRVRFLGWRRRPDVVAVLADADILLAPSVTSRSGNQEGTPVVILEAGAMEVPVVGTRHAGIPEVVENGVSGFLVPERDVEGLAGKLRLLAADPDLQARMGRAGREIMKARHDINVLNDALLGRYDGLAAGLPGE